MMDLNKSLELLEQYFRESAPETLKDMFDKYNKADFEGINVSSYFSSFAKHYTFFDNIPFIRTDAIVSASNEVGTTFTVFSDDKTTFLSSSLVKGNNETNFEINNIHNFASAA